MNLTSLLVFLAVMGAVCSRPVCPDNCQPADNLRLHHFKHVLELQNSSVAPWIIKREAEEAREPHYISYAVCKDCTVEHMIAKPISVCISVYKKISHSDPPVWCKCPYKLAVGCTCVSEEQQMTAELQGHESCAM